MRDLIHLPTFAHDDVFHVVVESPRGAAVGRSPSDDAELVPVDELVQRFSLDRVGLSAGVFDEEKLAWVNRHYLKIAEPRRIAELSVPYFRNEGVAMTPDA